MEREMELLAILVRRATAAAVWLTLLGVVLVVTDAHANDVVLALRDAAAWLAQPFDGIVRVDDAKAAVALNWSLAAAFYFFVGGFCARTLLSAAHPPRQPRAGRPPSGALLMM